MKSTLLMLLFFGIVSANAQTTYNLNWEIGDNGPDMDITIELGDTVIWTWTDSAPHTVQNTAGSSVETFNSGTLTGVGSTFSYTFTVLGINNYFCGIHGAASMNGSITVVPSLGIEDESFKRFAISSNPSNSILSIQLPENMAQGQLTIRDVLGKEVQSISFSDEEDLQVNVATISKGIYLVTIESGSSKQTKRFIKN